MPNTNKTEEEFEDKYLLDDDSSDEDESGDDSSEEESESGSDSETGSDDESGSGSDSDDDDSDDESGSGSDSDDSSSDKQKKKKKDKDDEKKDEEDDGSTAIYKIQQISSKLSWLLDDLHKTFKPKSVPKIDPKDVFPYPYTAIPQHSPPSHHRYHHNQYHNNPNIENNNIDEPQIHFANHAKSPISSPIRHGNNVDRGAGGHYIFPSYAAPPSKNEIKKLYQNYSDNERVKIAQNQKKERERKFLFSRKSRNDNVWQNSDFSDKFISASNQRQNEKIKSNSKRKLFASSNRRNNDMDDNEMPHSFDELYKHYDEQKRLIQQKQNKMKRMKNKLYWFRKNNTNKNNLKISEKQPLMKQANNNDKNQQLFPSKSLKETENNLLNKAAQILLGNVNDSKSSTKEYGVIGPDSPDSLQEKILHIASDQEEDENRMPTFV